MPNTLEAQFTQVEVLFIFGSIFFLQNSELWVNCYFTSQVVNEFGWCLEFIEVRVEMLGLWSSGSNYLTKHELKANTHKARSDAQTP
ncbi:hypothetical protein HanIR_Chr06g0289751 [Helianthus annuus]|nr:hypothetical protein HanIR_Chr06g0289751 [Helianthus annuus]